MKFLIIDRDRMAAQFLRKKLEDQGHVVIEESVKNSAIEILGNDKIDAILLDPAPLHNAKPLVLGIRRAVSNYPYIFVVSHSLKRSEVVQMGANDVLPKPINEQDLGEKILNAQRLVNAVGNIGDSSTDFPSAGGIIAKSAFNQLFISAIERADRYGEDSCVLFISINGYAELEQEDGVQNAQFIGSNLALLLGRLRRQSDIIAQVGPGDFALLLQRPQDEKEPLEAARRFSQALRERADIASNGTMTVSISVFLMALPAGDSIFSENIILGPKS